MSRFNISDEELAKILQESLKTSYSDAFDDIFKTSSHSSDVYGFVFSDEVKKAKKPEPDWSNEGMERDYRRTGRKVFSAQVTAAAQTEYFKAYAAQLLGLDAASIAIVVGLRLAGKPPIEVASFIAKTSTLLPVRSSCETYINDLKGT